jgi:hypothetical protein
MLIAITLLRSGIFLGGVQENHLSTHDIAIFLKCVEAALVHLTVRLLEFGRPKSHRESACLTSRMSRGNCDQALDIKRTNKDPPTLRIARYQEQAKEDAVLGYKYS